MIPAVNIRTVMSSMALSIGTTINRADQPGDHPSYPFGTYKELSSQEESAYMNIKEVIENPDPTASGVIIKTYEKSEAVMSINFLDKNRTDRVATLSTDALRWFKSVAGREVCETNEITAQIINPSIEDRTIYQQAYFENKFGFDVRFDYSGLMTEELESVDEINIGVTVDGEVQPDITYP